METEPTLRKPHIIAEDVWREVAAQHMAAARRHTDATRLRRDRGEAHPVEDFLFTYYPYPFALIERWHPGVGVALHFSDPQGLPVQFSGRHHRTKGNLVWLDRGTMTEKERDRLGWIAGLLRATRSKPPNFACHGLHEWAMVYRAQEIRHASIAPMRLAQEEIDALVESRPIACTHHDAFRFFAVGARPLNRIQPTLDSRHENEQPGCVHANMDLYKWAAKSMPWIGSELLLETFRLASGLRHLDMRASPYDLSRWGMAPVKIETTEGRKEYETTQRHLAEKASILRDRLISSIQTACDQPACQPSF